MVERIAVLDYDVISNYLMDKDFFHNFKDQNKPLVLVAGGGGFVGSFLCELLLQQNCRVVCLDNLITGSKKNLKNCLENPDFLLIKQDLTQPISQEISEANYIFHLAGIEAYPSETGLSLESLLVNISGTINLLNLAEKTGGKFLLGSTSRVFQARVATKELIDYFGKGMAGGIASFSEAKRSAEAITTEYAKKRGVDARIVRLDWIYGPRMNLKSGGILARMIKQVIKGGPVEIPGDGSKKIRPTFVSDVIYGLSKAMFGTGTSGRIYNLINPKEETIISLAYHLQSLFGQDLKIEYVSEKEVFFPEPEKELTTNEKLGWQPKIELDDGLRQTLQYFQKRIKKPTKPKVHIGLIKKEKEERKRFSFFGWKELIASIVFMALIIILFLPSSLIFNSLLGIKDLRLAYQAAISGNFTKTVTLAGTADREFNRAQGNLQTLGSIFSFFGQNQLENKIGTYLIIGSQAGKGMEKLGGIFEKVVKLNQAIFQDQPADINQLSSEMSVDLDSVYEQFSYLEGEIKSKPTAGQFLRRFDERLIENLSTIREIILKAKIGSLLIPDLVGVYQRKTYLVLFQNNMELRPTGGFIGSFALASFEGGKLVDFQVVDVYSADGQLKGHVEPPPEIRRYLGEAGWYLRDSNFNPDFPTSATQAIWFLEKELGRKVDGVVAIDLFLAQRILQTIGPVNLADYQEEINADNLFERAEYYSEVNFFPGSTQKKDFLGAIANALFERFKQAEEKQWLALAQSIYQSLKSKDLLIFLNNQEGARILADLGWDGGLRRVECRLEKGKCLVDYLMIVESNFGINKANYFVKRNLTHQVSSDSNGTVKEILRIEYHNQSQSEIFPAGRYKNYLRILTPAETELGKVTINGQEVKKDKIDETKIAGRTVFGFLVEVPIQERRTVEISYQLAEKFSYKSGGQYLLYLQKQPGIEDNVFNLWFVSPPKLKVVSTRLESSLADGLVSFTPKFDQDLVFEVFF